MSCSVSMCNNALTDYHCTNDGFEYKLNNSGDLIISGVSMNSYLPKITQEELNSLNWIGKCSIYIGNKCEGCKSFLSIADGHCHTVNCNGSLEKIPNRSGYKKCKKCGYEIYDSYNKEYSCTQMKTCGCVHGPFKSNSSNVYYTSVECERYIFRHESIPNIKSYDLQNLFQNCSVVKFEDYKELLLKQPNITTLNIKNCPNLEDVSFIKELKNLTTISFENCPKIEDISCLKNCEKLTDVSFIDCNSIKKAYWNRICNIKFNKCSNLIDVSELSNGDLNKFDFIDCTNLYDITPLGSCGNNNNYNKLRNTKIYNDPKWKCYFDDPSKSKMFYEKLIEEIKGTEETRKLRDENELLKLRLEKLEALFMAQQQKGFDQDILNLDI